MEATVALVNATEKNRCGSSYTSVFPSISSAIDWIYSAKNQPITDEEPANQPIGLQETDWYFPMHPIRLQEADHMQILVTGSLHLVGGVLKCLGPDAYKW